jgi:hypothetical protein
MFFTFENSKIYVQALNGRILIKRISAVICQFHKWQKKYLDMAKKKRKKKREHIFTAKC